MTKYLDMTPEQSKRLKVGNRVAWHDSANDQGTVTATDWSGVQIEWDNGKSQFFHHNNMTEVNTAPGAVAKVAIAAVTLTG